MINFGFIFGFLLGIPVIFIVEAFPVLVGAADLRRGRRLAHEPARDAADLRAGGAAQDRAAEAARPVPAPARARSPTSTPGSSPRTSSRSATSATTCSTARARTAPARCSRRRCGRPSTGRPDRCGRAVRVAMGTREYDTIRDSVAAEAVEYTMTPFTGPGVQRSARRRTDAASCSPRGCASCPTPTSSSCCARRSRRMSGCCTPTAPCSGSAPASCTWRSSGSEPMASDDRYDGDPTAGSTRSRRWRGSAPAPGCARPAGASSTSLRAGAELLERRRPRRAGRRAVATCSATSTGGRAKQDPPPTLRERGERLLHASADVNYEQGSHPAYERMLSDLAPDEARILRLLAQRRPAAGGRRARRARLRPRLAPGRPGLLDDRRRGGLPLADQVPAYLTQPQPPRPDLVPPRADRATTSATRCWRCSRT